MKNIWSGGCNMFSWKSPDSRFNSLWVDHFSNKYYILLTVLWDRSDRVFVKNKSINRIKSPIKPRQIVDKTGLSAIRFSLNIEVTFIMLFNLVLFDLKREVMLLFAALEWFIQIRINQGHNVTWMTKAISINVASSCSYLLLKHRHLRLSILFRHYF